MTEIPKEIAEALFATAKAVADNPLVKDMQNEFAKFKYVPIDSYYAAIPPLALKHGLFWRCRETEVGSEGKTFKFQFSFDLIHESGATVEEYDTVTIFHPAQGAQSSGSARSYADKLFMRTAFKCVTGEKDSEFFNREPEKDFDTGDADATDNSNAAVNAKQAADAARIWGRAFSEPSTVKPEKSDTATPMSLAEWREGLLGHPESPVKRDGNTIEISEAANSEGANLILKTFSTFMPRVNDYEDSKSCITALNGFYKTNKKAVAALRKLDPKHEEAVLAYFKAAKAAANDGNIWELEE